MLLQVEDIQHVIANIIFARLKNEVSKFCFYLKGRIKGRMFSEICLKCAHNKLIIIILERADK